MGMLNVVSFRTPWMFRMLSGVCRQHIWLYYPSLTNSIGTTADHIASLLGVVGKSARFSLRLNEPPAHVRAGVELLRYKTSREREYRLEEAW